MFDHDSRSFRPYFDHIRPSTIFDHIRRCSTIFDHIRPYSTIFSPYFNYIRPYFHDVRSYFDNIRPYCNGLAADAAVPEERTVRKPSQVQPKIDPNLPKILPKSTQNRITTNQRLFGPHLGPMLEKSWTLNAQKDPLIQVAPKSETWQLSCPSLSCLSFFLLF